MKEKNFNICVIVIVTIGLVLFAIPTIVIDPYFHYHSPLKKLQYTLNNERYQNNGIVKHFEYNALVTGTSMTENFKTSEVDALFDVVSVKTPYNGGTYGEINKNILVALKNNPDIKIVIRSLDYTGLVKDKDYADREKRDDYPHYIIDSNPFNDVSYILNKSVVNLDIAIINDSKTGGGITSFDEYANWNDNYEFGKNAVLNTFERAQISDTVMLNDQEAQMVRENIRQNVLETAEAYPNTTFYVFFPPYSICYWDNIKRAGQLDYMIEAEKVAIEELLTCENIKVFSFTNNFAWICNLDNYKDQAHYGEWINSAILESMQKNEFLLTKENYLGYLAEIKEFYSNYDYDAIYQ